MGPGDSRTANTSRRAGGPVDLSIRVPQVLGVVATRVVGKQGLRLSGTANTRKDKNLDKTMGSMPLVTPEYTRAKLAEGESFLMRRRETAGSRINRSGCPQGGKEGNVYALSAARNGMGTARLAICYHTTIYIDSTTK